MASGSNTKAGALTPLELSNFFKELSLLFDGGISLGDAAYIMADNGADTRFRPICDAIASSMDNGATVADAFQNTGRFPGRVISMLQVGQTSGKLDAVLAGLAQDYERQDYIQRSVRNALTFPLIMIAVMFAVLSALIIKVLPMFAQVFIETGAKMPLILNLITSSQSFTVTLIAILVILLAAAIAMFVKAGSMLACGGSTRGLLASLPLLKQVLRKSRAGDFASSMSLLLAGGVLPQDAVLMIGEQTDSTEIRSACNAIDRYMDAGDSLAAAINQTGLFDGTYTALLAAGEKSGHTDEIMNLIAGRYAQEANDLIGRFISIIEPALVIAMSVIVGTLLLSIMLPLMNVLSSI